MAGGDSGTPRRRAAAPAEQSVDTIKAAYEGKDISGAYRFTDTFIKRAGRWQVLTTQGTGVSPHK